MSAEVKATAQETVWVGGRFDARAADRQVLFGRMYEDTGVELATFRPGGRVLCIASAGCTAMRLAAAKHEVVAVDINPVQLAYAERRFAGDPGVRGRAEKVMDFGRFFAPLVGWWPARVRAFLALDDVAAQRAYWAKHLDTWRFRLALTLAFSFTALRAVYAPRFLDFLPKRLGRVFHDRIERCVTTHPNRANPFARMLLEGTFPDEPVPPEARQVRLVHADAASFLEGEPAGSFDGFTLSNILDGAAPEYRARLFAAVKRAARPGAMVVLRSFGEPQGPLPTNRATDDRAMLWGIVDVRPAAELD